MKIATKSSGISVVEKYIPNAILFPEAVKDRFIKFSDWKCKSFTAVGFGLILQFILYKHIYLFDFISKQFWLKCSFL